LVREEEAEFSLDKSGGRLIFLTKGEAAGNQGNRRNKPEVSNISS
jgi:hypothetical protein